MGVKVTSQFTSEPLPAVPATSAPVARASSPSVVAKKADRNSVSNYNTSYAKGDLGYQLQDAILRQMSANPENFADDIVKDGYTRGVYAKEFAEHFLDKLANEEVKVLNETVVTAMAAIRLYNHKLGRGVKALYDYLYKGGKPEHKAPDQQAASSAPVVKKFKGC